MYYHLYRDAANYWRWTLFSINYRKIADSAEGYHNRADALSAINLVKFSGTAPVRE